MAFHPSVDEDAPGFWGGYYRGLAYLLWACIPLLNLAVILRNFILLPYDQAIETIEAWFAFSHTSFYATMGILIGLGVLSFFVSGFVDKLKKEAETAEEKREEKKKEKK